MMSSTNRAPRRHVVLGVATGLAGVLVGALIVAPPASATTSTWKSPALQKTPSVSGRSVPVRKAPADPAAAAARRVSPAPVWPAAGSVDVTVPTQGTVAAARKQSSAVRAGSLPIWVGLSSTRPADTRGAAGSPADLVTVRVQGRAATDQAGVHGLLISLQGRNASAERVSLRVGYASFAGAYGGDWASRLRLFQLPGCVLSTPQVATCRVGTPVVGTNDSKAKTVTADVAPFAPRANARDGSTAREPAVYAMAAAASGPQGSYSATPLAPSASWQVSEQTGDFSWSYPFRVPPAVNGPTPQLGISYSAGSVDGRTASTNSQPSWIGEGHSLESGYVERKYVSCADDQPGGNNTSKTGDLCWRSDNATLVLGGHSSDLVKDATTGVWRLKNDDASRMQRLTGATNGDNDKEYWRLTTTDGTQYHFGLGKRYAADTVNTNSAWTVPVFGNQAGEPCRQATFAASYCTQAWRWNLDYVVEPHGNTMTYFYTPELNNYARNMTGMSTYVRGGYLTRIEYGERRGTEATTTAPSQVVFGVAERCYASGAVTCLPAQLTAANAAHWPDVPFDQICTTSTCPNRVSPSFFTRNRLTVITTQAWSNGSPTEVDSWTLNQSFPGTGDGTSKGLWLNSITHSGKVGGKLTLPAVVFSGIQKPNRVDGVDSAPPLIKWRVAAVTSETGGRVNVTYSTPDCAGGTANMPSSPQTDYKRCFPVFWAAYGAEKATLNYFHKYVVTQLVEQDLTSGSPSRVTDYEYVGAPAWHYDDNELVEPKLRTYGQFRGYTFVRVRTGSPGQVQQTLTQSLFMRGMHGDRMPGGTTRSVFVTDSEGGTLTDSDRLSGFKREQIVYNGSGGPQVSGTINDPWLSAPTATNGIDKAYLLATAKVRDRTVLAAGGYRRTEVATTFDGYAMPVTVGDRGDTAVSTDDLCTRMTYARNTSSWVVTPVARQETVSVPCTASPVRPADVVSDVRMFYDGSAVVGAAPTYANVTKTETLTSWSGGPVYAQKTRSTYDAHGRMVAVYDGLDRATTTAFTPATGGPVTQTVTTNALGHASTSTLSPAWGSPTAEVDANGKRTDLSYDPLGRLTGAWLPGRAKAAGVSPQVKFDYLIDPTLPVAVGTHELRNDGSYTPSYALFDGLLRPRQTQTSAIGGGRLLDTIVYDSRGLVTDNNGPSYSSSSPTTSLLAINDVDVTSQTRTSYDGAGRPTVQALRTRLTEKWRTTTSYGGDRVSVTPPAGGTPTTTIVDGRGRTSALRQYRGATASGAYDETTYGYTPAGQQASVTDPAGNRWSYGYDLRGRPVSSADPDSGRSSSTYDNADQVLTSTDARSQTLAYEYDLLGRKTALRQGSAAGATLATWTFDTLAKGKATSSTRFAGGNAYTSAVSGYDANYRPTGSRITIPAGEGALAGTYASDLTYNDDGGVKTMTQPAVPGLLAETLSMQYGSVGEPTILNGQGAYVNGTRYTSFGEVQQLTLGNTVGKFSQQTFNYDESTHRLTSARVLREGAAGPDAAVAYSYDPAGNLTQAVDTAGGPADVQCFGYDYLRRLTQAWTPTAGCAGAPTTAGLGGPAPYWQSFGYDLTGNRTSEVSHAAGGDTTRSYVYPAAGTARPHGLARVDQTGPAGTRQDSFGYDASGSTTSRAVAGRSQGLTWDAEGHLASVVDGASMTSFLYDADGDRLIRRDPTATTLYLDGTEIRLDKGTGGASSTRYYSFAGKTVAVRTSAGAQFIASDPHGTGQVSISAGGAMVKRRHTPFGGSRDPAAVPWPGERGFVDGTMDASTGLTHLGAREYDPATGRFISVDPIIDSADPQQMNGYAYANNNPTSMSDPDGLRTTCMDGGGSCGNPNGNPGPAPSGGGGGSENSGGGGSGGGPTAGQQAQQNLNAAHAHKAKAKRQLIRAALGIAKIAADVLGITAGIDCLTTGNVAACGEAALTIAATFVGGLVVKIIAKYAFRWKKAAQLGKALWKLAKQAVGAVTDFFKAGKQIKRAEAAVESAAKSCAANSFTPSTPVRLADGTHKPIQAVKIGDKVLAADPVTGKSGARPVVATIIGNGPKHLVGITIDIDGPAGTKTGTVTATEGHPFWSPNQHRWVDAGHLQAGDQLQDPTGQQRAVLAVRHYTALQRVHNLTIAGLHTYYVQAATTPILVHNCGVASSGLPNALTGGRNAETGIDVYQGLVHGKSQYVGITNNLARRQSQHGSNYVLSRMTTSPVTRGQGRAIEQAMMDRQPFFANKINSISPTQPHYQQAVNWGEAWLRGNGF